MDGWRPKAPPTCMSHIVAPPASRGGCAVPAPSVPGSSGKLPLNPGTLGPASSHLQAAQPVPFSDLPKAIGFRWIKRAPRSQGQISQVWDSQTGKTAIPTTAQLPSQQASLEGVCWGWHSRQPARPLSRPSPSTTLIVCILTRIGRLLKVVFFCRTKQSCLYCCLEFHLGVSKSQAQREGAAIQCSQQRKWSCPCKHGFSCLTQVFHTWHVMNSFTPFYSKPLPRQPWLSSSYCAFTLC